MTLEHARAAPIGGYRGSKTFAERAAWAFVKERAPGFSLATIQPPIVMGPPVYPTHSLDEINESNKRIRDLCAGLYATGKLAPAPVPLWADVRDVALAHVLCVEKANAAGLRFFVTAGAYSNSQLAEIIREHFPQFRDWLPTGQALEEAWLPEDGDIFGFDNSRSRKVLGLKYRLFDTCVLDTVRSMIHLL